MRFGKELQRHISSSTELADDAGQSPPPFWGSSRGQSWFQLSRHEPESTRFTVLSSSNSHKGGLTFIDAHTVYPVWQENGAERDFRGIKVNVRKKSVPGSCGKILNPSSGEVEASLAFRASSRAARSVTQRLCLKQQNKTVTEDWCLSPRFKLPVREHSMTKRSLHL